jgi:hypothetical protein
MVDLLPSMRLLDADTSEFLILSPAAGNGGVIKVVDFNPGYPEIRKVQVPNPGYSGAADYTSLYGAKALAITLRLDPSAGLPIMSTLAALRAWCAPNRSLQLFYTPSGMAERLVYLRGDQLASDLPMATMLTGVVDVQMQWTCPTGVEFSSVVTETQVKLQTPITTGGRTYPLTYPRTYPAQVGTGVQVITNNGTIDSAPVVRIFGPAIGPRLVNETTGLVMEFLTLNLGPTDYLEVNMAAKTAQLNGEAGANANRRSYLSTAGWWVLKRGANIIRFTAQTGSTPSQAIVLSQDAWI